MYSPHDRSITARSRPDCGLWQGRGSAGREGSRAGSRVIDPPVVLSATCRKSASRHSSMVRIPGARIGWKSGFRSHQRPGCGHRGVVEKSDILSPLRHFPGENPVGRTAVPRRLTPSVSSNSWRPGSYWARLWIRRSPKARPPVWCRLLRWRARQAGRGSRLVLAASGLRHRPSPGHRYKPRSHGKVTRC